MDLPFSELDSISAFDTHPDQDVGGWDSWLRQNLASGSTPLEFRSQDFDFESYDPLAQCSIFHASDANQLPSVQSENPLLIPHNASLSPDIDLQKDSNGILKYQSETIHTFRCNTTGVHQDYTEPRQNITVESPLWCSEQDVVIPDDFVVPGLSATLSDQANTTSWPSKPGSATNSRHRESRESIEEQIITPCLTKAGSRKRRFSSTRKVGAETNLDSCGGESKIRKAPIEDHSCKTIEKRYRDNLIDRFAQLRQCVPTLRGIPGGEGAKEIPKGLTPTHKLNKATIIFKATEYIIYLEKRKQEAEETSAELEAYIALVEASIGFSFGN